MAHLARFDGSTGEPLDHLLLVTYVDREEPAVASIADVFAGAAWHERETHEMFGIAFGVLELEPLLLPDGFEGHPLRKEFVLASRVAKAWPGAKEPGESDADSTHSPGRRRIKPPGVPEPSEWGPDAGSAGGEAPRSPMSDLVDIVVRCVLVVGAFMTLPLLVGQMEHKVMAHMQSRVGPMKAGAFHGWAQLVADGVKFVQKESIVPAAADNAVFRIAPAVALVPYLVAMIAIPLGPFFGRTDLIGQDLDLGLFFVLAAMSVGVLGSLMGGLGSGNKYSYIGGMRVAAQLMCYELPMVLAAASVAMAAGTLSLVGIANAVGAVVAAGPAPGPDRVLHRGPRRAAAPAVRCAAGRRRAGDGAADRVRRHALRDVPAG